METSLYGYHFFIGVHVSACTSMYVYTVLVCVNTRLLQHAYGSQRKPLACLHKCSWYLNTKPQILMSAPYPLIHLPSSLYNTFELINEEGMKKI